MSNNIHTLPANPGRSNISQKTSDRKHYDNAHYHKDNIEKSPQDPRRNPRIISVECAGNYQNNDQKS